MRFPYVGPLPVICAGLFEPARGDARFGNVGPCTTITPRAAAFLRRVGADGSATIRFGPFRAYIMAHAEDALEVAWSEVTRC